MSMDKANLFNPSYTPGEDLRTERVVRADGTWAVNWSVVADILYAELLAEARAKWSWSRAEAIDSYRRHAPFAQRWAQIASAPPAFETNFPLVNLHVAAYFPRALADFKTRMNSTPNMRDRVAELESRVRATIQNEYELSMRRTAAYQRFQASVEAAVSMGSRYVETARLIRNASASGLVLVAVWPIAGPTTAAYSALSARVAFPVAGSLLKGVYKYQDTKNLGAATITSATNLTFLFIPGIQDLRKLDYITAGGAVALGLVIAGVQGTLGGLASHVEGHSVQQSLIAGGLSAFTAGLGAMGGERAAIEAGIMGLIPWGKLLLPGSAQVRSVPAMASKGRNLSDAGALLGSIDRSYVRWAIQEQ
jgi:hypothetical protein